MAHAASTSASLAASVAVLSRPTATLVVMLLAVLACGWCASSPHDDVDAATILIAQASPRGCVEERQGGQGHERIQGRFFY